MYQVKLCGMCEAKIARVVVQGDFRIWLCRGCQETLKTLCSLPPPETDLALFAPVAT